MYVTQHCWLVTRTCGVINNQQDRLCQWLRSKCSDLMAAVWFMEHPITALASSGEIRSPFRNAVHHMLVRNNNSNSGRVVVQTTDTRRTSTTQEEECMPYDWFGVCPESGNLICPNTVLNLIDELTIILREVPKVCLHLFLSPLSVSVSVSYSVVRCVFSVL